MYALKVENLSVSFRMYDRGWKKKDLRVISDLNIRLAPGEILSVVGSSGSGKSLLAHAILGILPANAGCSGRMTWFGEELTPRKQRELRGRELALVPQSVEFLDPLMRVGRQISRDREKAVRALNRYQLSPETASLYPFQLSGGMARRVLIASAPETARVIVADEPTPGLTPALADAVMERFRALADNGAAILVITHDLDLALRWSDFISVFYAGTTVETAKASDFTSPDLLRHPYSRALWRAMPQNGFQPTPGKQPYAGDLPAGCVYAPRCELYTQQCTIPPETRTVRNCEVKCHHAR